MPLIKTDAGIIHIPSDTIIGTGLSMGDETLSGASFKGQFFLRGAAASILEEREALRKARLDYFIGAICCVGFVAMVVCPYL